MGEKLLRVKKFFTFYVFLPVILDIVIESLNRKSVFSAFSYMVDKPFLFMFNVLIIMLTLSVAMYFKREIFVLTLMSVVWLLFGVINFVILHFRVTPFSAVDFTLISSAISVSGHYLTAFNVMMIFFAIAILVISLICLFKRTPCFQKNTTKKAYMLSTLVILTLAAGIVVMHKSSTSVQALAENYTNISEAYENYGFVYCFANSIIDTGIKKPEDYSEESMAQIKDSIKDTGTDEPEVKPDIVMIQLESFFDICDVKGVSFSRDPLPNFHRLQKEYSNGQLTVPTVGAGTVNTEFEVLTGMSQHDFGVSEYPYKTVLKSKTSESICNDLAQIGYSSHAVHNNTATFYGRNKVFSNLGFDSFTSVEYMNNITLNPNGWAKDDVMVDEILKTLDDNKNKSEFTFGITVQSHGKYNDVKTDSKDPVKVYNAPTGKEESYEYYVNEIDEVDQMIGKLVYALGKREKPTVLVLYGDHLPSLDLSNEDLEDGSLYETQYIIWNNYGLKEKDQDLKAYELYPEVLDRIGIHTGVITQFHQQADRSSDTYQTDLKALEYDLLYGENYIYDGEVPFTASNLQMGTNPLKIADVYQKDGEYIVRGDNFTPYCRVYFDGKELESQWIDEHHLKLKDVPERSDRKQDKQKSYEPDEIPNSFVVEVQNGDGVKLSYSNNLRWKNTSLGKK
ncbi:LTA synthase family protein [Jutongia huaianensis]|uniref:Sulfatase-like hydrolase/transferase n=1 Tax=Jutongia huaianensis TaxID=2763668 RepID=A0ABR7N3Y7_9FIRM|nr:sulfatase-like hydrolase/transferase [Jutongia huaianensis]MBC8563090.1 sulfatase-like hydrolase/transferase [Jutongia huaianensis]